MIDRPFADDGRNMRRAVDFNSSFPVLLERDERDANRFRRPIESSRREVSTISGREDRSGNRTPVHNLCRYEESKVMHYYHKNTDVI